MCPGKPSRPRSEWEEVKVHNSNDCANQIDITTCTRPHSLSEIRFVGQGSQGSFSSFADLVASKLSLVFVPFSFTLYSRKLLSIRRVWDINISIAYTR